MTKPNKRKVQSRALKSSNLGNLPDTKACLLYLAGEYSKLVWYLGMIWARMSSYEDASALQKNMFKTKLVKFVVELKSNEEKEKLIYEILSSNELSEFLFGNETDFLFL